MSNRLLAGTAVLATAVALTGCGGSGSGNSASSAAPAPVGGGTTISIKNFAYSPKDLHVKVGQTITVTNEDSSTHTITAEDKSFDSKDLGQNKTYSFTASKAGTFKYICSIHQYMTGSIVVA